MCGLITLWYDYSPSATLNPGHKSLSRIAVVVGSAHYRLQGNRVNRRLKNWSNLGKPVPTERGLYDEFPNEDFPIVLFQKCIFKKAFFPKLTLSRMHFSPKIFKSGKMPFLLLSAAIT